MNFDFKSPADKNDFSIYIPNSLIISKLKKAILNNPSRFYDPTIYDFYNISTGFYNATEKKYTLELIKKAPDASNFPAITDIDVKRHYDESNFLHREIALLLKNNRVIVNIAGIDNKPIEILNTSITQLLIKLEDPAFPKPYSYSGKIKIIFSSASVFITYSNNVQIISELTKKLDGDSRFQNVGISTVFSYDYIKNFTTTNNVFFKTNSPHFPDLQLKAIDMRNNPLGDKASVIFKIDNKNLPAVIIANAQLDTKTGKLLSLGNYSYNRTNLTRSQINVMESYVKRIKDYVLSSQLVSSYLSPKVEGDVISFIFPEKEYKTTCGFGSIFYFKENVIGIINLN